MENILSSSGRGKEKKDIGSWSSSKIPCPNAQTTPTENMDELVVRGLISPASSQENSATNHPSTIAPVIPALTTKNIYEDRASLSKE
ncbi:hypothetical protein KY290_013710 [Solanum tuberosum]|uniref:Uncharacterized protein n=1 Tax=Solanum tuberosum TaxID=4113 RepID=A0ABQ7VMJ4_SOLTU|nr:hypothetical protein KY289_013824 [Solanum tuberosum]KAH0769729.1 hypothetical protein KY290_013710 [Solanum tuberosum]